MIAVVIVVAAIAMALVHQKRTANQPAKKDGFGFPPASSPVAAYDTAAAPALQTTVNNGGLSPVSSGASAGYETSYLDIDIDEDEDDSVEANL